MKVGFDQQHEAAWQEYRTRLLLFVRSRVHDDVLAEDIVHDSLVKAWDQRDKVRNEAAFIPWLFQITMNTMRDSFKGRRYASTGIELENLQDESLLADSPDNRTDFTRCMLAMIQSMDESSRSILIRSELEGVTMRQIAEEAGMSLSGVKSRVQRSRAKLRDAILACCKLELNQRGQVVNADEHDCSC